jgi:peptidoglycan/xylan/chitin deacetylase (PgdA/CDA1 family)
MQRTAAAQAAERARRQRRLRVQRAAALAALALAAAAVAFAVVHVRDRPSPASARHRSSSHARTARKRHRDQPIAALPAAAAPVRGSAARRMPIPILMYHVVSRPRPGTPNRELWIPQERFARQMHALRRAGYRAITLRQAFAGWLAGAGLPRRPVVVSFDDGYLSHYTHARPVLRKLGWPGVLNLALRNLGRGGLTSHQVRALIAGGWELDSHTISHADLTTLGPAALRHEIADSRRALQRRFGVPADFFCYPAGRFDARVVAAVRAAGYLGATTTIEGYASAAQAYELDRVRVNGSDTATTLLARLERERPPATSLQTRR